MCNKHVAHIKDSAYVDSYLSCFRDRPIPYSFRKCYGIGKRVTDVITPRITLITNHHYAHKNINACDALYELMKQKAQCSESLCFCGRQWIWERCNNCSNICHILFMFLFNFVIYSVVSLSYGVNFEVLCSDLVYDSN